MIIDGRQRAIMEFVRTVNSGGHRPVARDVLEWLDRRDPLPGKKGELISPAKPGTPGTPGTFGLAAQSILSQSSQMTQISQQIHERLHPPMNPGLAAAINGFAARGSLGSMFGTPGTGGTPARYAPDGPPEDSIEQLIRFRWVDIDDDDGLGLTELGHALLRADLRANNADPEVLVLGADDPLAWGSLLGKISEHGQCLIIDPFLKAREFAQIVEFTTPARVLVGPGLKRSEVVELCVLLATPGYERLEVRQAPRKMIHDRYVISDDAMHMIGASMNNIGGTTTTMLIPIPDPSASTLRASAEEWWSRSKPLGVGGDE